VRCGWWVEMEGRGGCRLDTETTPEPPTPDPPSARTPPHLLPGVELQQAARKGGGGRKVPQLEEDRHGAAQAERQVHRLQRAVGEVGGQLGRARGAALVFPQLL